MPNYDIIPLAVDLLDYTIQRVKSKETEYRKTTALVQENGQLVERVLFAKIKDGELESKLAAITERRDTAQEKIKSVERQMADLSLVMKHAATYRQFRPIHEQYRRSRDKEKFLRGHESEIILFESAARELKRLGAVPLPATEKLEAQRSELAQQKDTLLAEYRAARTEAREYETIKQNVDILLTAPQEPKHQHSHHIE